MAAPGEAAAPVPIGRPIANAQVYILDHYLNPVPIGVCGELYIGGDGLARDYLNHPELTAETFIPHPLSDKPGARLYKTGDLARYLPDGNIEFIGRIDHQVKIRGFRIELGEIESVLDEHPAVRESVVIAREDAPGDPSAPLRAGPSAPLRTGPSAPLRTGKRLVAYVVPSGRPGPSVGKLREFLKERLPEYMIPSVFMFLEALPLLPNGKVDRRVLPAPDQSRPELENPFIAPRTPVEAALARIWAGVLKLEQIGIHDNFFDLGGHSLLATQVISGARDTFQVELPLRCLFENPTVAGLAVQVTQTQVKRAVPEEMARMVAELEALPDEEARQLVVEEAESERRRENG
ncbi:MAG: AMP-binding protein [Deltaproteobacteria bacterium]|nr:AMP-binding protein [Deltaproteobacteria bacterium]